MGWDSKLILKDTINALRIISNSKNNCEINLKDISFATPFLITPITAYANSPHKIKYKILNPIDLDCSKYLNVIKFPHSIDTTSLNSMDYNTYLPLFKFSMQNTMYDQKILVVIDKMITSYGLEDNKNIINVFLGELIDNIREHSKSENNFICCQKYKKKLAISIVDRGITIQGSYENAGISFKNDIEALKFALKGKSTKKEFGDERGTGIPNTLNWVCDALKGNLLIVSRNSGVYRENTAKIEFFDLKKDILGFEGTIINIFFEIPNEKIDYLSYVNK